MDRLQSHLLDGRIADCRLVDQTMSDLAQGLIYLAALFGGAHVGSFLAEWASRYGESELKPVTRSALAKRSVWRARAAMLSPLLSTALCLIGGVLAARIYFLPSGRFEVAFLFLFVSLSLLLGLVRGAYETFLTLGPVVDTRWPWSVSGQYLDDPPGVRTRGVLRLLVCLSALVLMAAASRALRSW